MSFSVQTEEMILSETGWKALGETDEMIIDTDITVVAENWPSVLGTSLVKKLQGEKGLWEIRSRISDGKRIARVLFTVEAGEIILLPSFVKKSQRTPRKDLRIARRRNRLWKGGLNK